MTCLIGYNRGRPKWTMAPMAIAPPVYHIIVCRACEGCDIHTCLHIQAYIYLHTRFYTCTDNITYKRTYAWIHARMHTYINAYLYISPFTVTGAHAHWVGSTDTPSHTAKELKMR